MEKYPQFLAGCVALSLPVPEKEVQFAKDQKRKWKTDYLFTLEDGRKIAVEIEGGAWTKGRHTRPQGFINDMHKYNCYAVLGITLLRFTSEQATKQPIWCARFIRNIIDGTKDQTLFAAV